MDAFEFEQTNFLGVLNNKLVEIDKMAGFYELKSKIMGGKFGWEWKWLKMNI